MTIRQGRYSVPCAEGWPSDGLSHDEGYGILVERRFHSATAVVSTALIRWTPFSKPMAVGLTIELVEPERVLQSLGNASR